MLVVVGLGAVHAREPRVDVGAGAPAMSRARRSSLIFAFLGVESALVPSGEVRDPARTVPRAIFLAMIGVTLLYLAVQIVTQGILGAALAGAEDAARRSGRRGDRARPDAR